MPIPSLQRKTEDEEEEHHAANAWIVMVKWILILGVIGGIVFFFIRVDKERLTEHVSLLSDLVEQFDYWIEGAASSFAAQFE
jgi:hypothetical protein